MKDACFEHNHHGVEIRSDVCSNLRYSWVTCLILSNFYNFSQLVLSTHPLLLYTIFVTLSNFCHLIKLLSFSHPLLSIYVLRYLTTYKCTCWTHHKQNAYSRLIVRTISAPIHHFDLGGPGYGWGLFEEQPVTFKLKRRRQYLWIFLRDWRTTPFTKPKWYFWTKKRQIIKL